MGAAADPFIGPTGVDILLSQTHAEAVASRVDETRYREIITAVIKEVAEMPNVVILGRGSQVILKDLPHALHVKLTAPHRAKVEQTMVSEKLGREGAEKLVAEKDRQRREYLKKFFKADADDPTIYDLIINTGRGTYTSAARIIASAALEKEIAPTTAPA